MKIQLNKIWLSFAIRLLLVILFLSANSYANEIMHQQDDSIGKPVIESKALKLATFESPNEALIDVAMINRASISLFYSTVSVGFIQLQSSLNPISVYRLNEDRFRFSVLRSPFAGGSILLPFAVSFGSKEILEFERKYGALFFLPAYSLNPELNIALTDHFKIFANYSFDLVQD